MQHLFVQVWNVNSLQNQIFSVWWGLQDNLRSLSSWDREDISPVHTVTHNIWRCDAKESWYTMYFLTYATSISEGLWKLADVWNSWKEIHISFYWFQKTIEHVSHSLGAHRIPSFKATRDSRAVQHSWGERLVAAWRGQAPSSQHYKHQNNLPFHLRNKQATLMQLESLLRKVHFKILQERWPMVS